MIRVIKHFVWAGLVFCLLNVSASIAETGADNNSDEVKFTRSTVGQAYYDQIQAVLAQKEFGEKKKVNKWRLKEQKEEDEKESKFIKWLSDFLNAIGGSGDKENKGALHIASILEVLLWSLLIGVIVYLLVKYREQIKNLIGYMQEPATTTALPSTMFGLDVKKTSMPEDVVGSATAFWQAGEHRQAIALLLRASLIKLLHEHDCQFRDSDTEAECCERLEKHVPRKLSEYMRLLVQVWQQIAYAHRAPSDNVFNALCRQWQEVF